MMDPADNLYHTVPMEPKLHGIYWDGNACAMYEQAQAPNIIIDLEVHVNSVEFRTSLGSSLQPLVQLPPNVKVSVIISELAFSIVLSWRNIPLPRK